MQLGRRAPILGWMLSCSVFTPGIATAAEPAPCETARTTANLADTLDSAERRYSALDMTGFRTATDDSRAVLPCLSDPMPRHLAARYHRFIGVRAFIDRDPELSTRAFAAARAIEPSYTFPETLVPAGNPLLEDYQAIDVASGSNGVVPEPAQGYLQFDGRPGLERPISWPTVLQLVNEDGSVARTLYLLPVDDMPAYDVKPPPVEVPPGVETPLDPPTTGKKGATVSVPRWKIPVTALAGGALVASAGLYGAAVKQRQDFRSHDWQPGDEDAVAAAANRNHRFVITSGVLGGVAVAGGFIVGFVGPW